MSPNALEDLRLASAQKLARLKDSLRACESALVAFSGGVDSTFVVAVAREVLGDRAVALTAHSPSVPQAEREDARALAAHIGVRHLEKDSHEQEDPGYVANASDRCYYCKRELFRICEETARAEGIAAVLDGFNADDLGDHRPGHRAAQERRVRSPLAEAGFTKEEVRAWSEAYGAADVGEAADGVPRLAHPLRHAGHARAARRGRARGGGAARARLPGSSASGTTATSEGWSSGRTSSRAGSSGAPRSPSP